MLIQYYGHSCFKIITKPGGRATEDVVVFYDPFDKSIGLRSPQGQADLILVSHEHYDHNNIQALKGDPLIFRTPGEYSAKGINIIGIDSFHDEKEGAEHGRNTVFILESEDLRICHMGDLGAPLSGAQLESIGHIDVLMIPVGGIYTLDGKKAAELTREISPSIVIPIHYKVPELKLDISDEKDFCSEMGNCPKEKVNRITLKKKDLEGKEMEVVLMKI